MATFPSDQSANGQEFLAIFLDPALQIPAPIVSVATGQPIPQSTIIAGPDGLWPLFTCVGATVLYAQDDTGAPVILRAAVGDGTAVSTFTGSRSGATAALLEQVIQAGISAGLPWVDNTTA